MVFQNRVYSKIEVTPTDIKLKWIVPCVFSKKCDFYFNAERIELSMDIMVWERVNRTLLCASTHFLHKNFNVKLTRLKGIFAVSQSLVALNLQQTSVCDRVCCSVAFSTEQCTRSQTLVCCGFSAAVSFWPGYWPADPV